jgi:hypothetical protein
MELCLFDAGLVDEKRAELAVPILVHDKDHVMFCEKRVNVLRKWKSTHA